MPSVSKLYPLAKRDKYNVAVDILRNIDYSISIVPADLSRIVGVSMTMGQAVSATMGNTSATCTTSLKHSNNGRCTSAIKILDQALLHKEVSLHRPKSRSLTFLTRCKTYILLIKERSTKKKKKKTLRPVGPGSCVFSRKLFFSGGTRRMQSTGRK